MSGPPILIMAGGTGGHIYPALEVARALAQAGRRVVWLGTRRGLEARLVEAAGIPICFVRAQPLRGKGALRWLLAPVKLLAPTIESLLLIRRLEPALALGMGGFVTGPGGVAAWLLGCPLLIHEQNAVPGFTNRMLARLARGLMEAFPGSFPPRWRALHTGNPVRAEILALPPPEARLAGRAGPLRLLVLGGSQGARALNEVVPQAIARLARSEPVEVRHQAGECNLAAARESYRRAALAIEPVAYIEKMAEAFGWADLVVCRSGAMTVCELAAAGVASILVPFPHAVADEQTANARYLSDAGAAVLVVERNLDAGRLSGLIAELAAQRERLLEMARAARARAMPDATRRVMDLCLEVAGARA